MRSARALRSSAREWPTASEKAAFSRQSMLVRQQSFAVEGAAQEILAHAVAVHLHLRVDGHDVAHEVQVAEGHAGLQRVDGDAAVGAQHVVGVELAHALLRLAAGTPSAEGAKSVYL